LLPLPGSTGPDHQRRAKQCWIRRRRRKRVHDPNRQLPGGRSLVCWLTEEGSGGRAGVSKHLARPGRLRCLSLGDQPYPDRKTIRGGRCPSTEWDWAFVEGRAMVRARVRKRHCSMSGPVPWRRPRRGGTRGDRRAYAMIRAPAPLSPRSIRLPTGSAPALHPFAEKKKNRRRRNPNKGGRVGPGWLRSSTSQRMGPRRGLTRSQPENDRRQKKIEPVASRPVAIGMFFRPPPRYGSRR